MCDFQLAWYFEFSLLKAEYKIQATAAGIISLIPEGQFYFFINIKVIERLRFFLGNYELGTKGLTLQGSWGCSAPPGIAKHFAESSLKEWHKRSKRFMSINLSAVRTMVQMQWSGQSSGFKFVCLCHCAASWAGMWQVDFVPVVLLSYSLSTLLWSVL